MPKGEVNVSRGTGVLIALMNRVWGGGRRILGKNGIDIPMR
jgi:hypothetical protein